MKKQSEAQKQKMNNLTRKAFAAKIRRKKLLIVRKKAAAA